MPLAALGPEAAKRAVALPKPACPSLPGSHTHPLPDLWTPALARSIWRILLPLHPLALSAPSSKSSPFAQTHSSRCSRLSGKSKEELLTSQPS